MTPAARATTTTMTLAKTARMMTLRPVPPIREVWAAVPVPLVEARVEEVEELQETQQPVGLVEPVAATMPERAVRPGGGGG